MICTKIQYDSRAGIILLNLLEKKLLNEKVLLVISEYIRFEITNPEITKKTSTPKYPKLKTSLLK